MHHLFSGKVFLVLSFIAASLSITAQNGKKNITLEDIWSKGTFSSESVRGLRSMNDGLKYTILERKADGVQLSRYSYESGEFEEPIIDVNSMTVEGEIIQILNYEFSKDESKVLVSAEVEPIYRHSSKAHFYIYDLENGETTKLSEGSKQMYASFSPDGSKVAFVKDYNLFYKDLQTGEEVQITSDGEKNKILNGMSDWVYEEELVLVQAFKWSSDGEKIAFYRFDESEVKQFDMKIYDGLYPSTYTFKYPKAGEENSKVKIKIYDLESEKTLDVKFNKDYEYITSIEWTEDPNTLAVLGSNRHQNNLDILLANASSGESKVLYTETSDTYIEMPFKVYFLEDNQHFVVLSEKSGYNHIYLYNMKGKLVKQLTKGNWEVTDFYGVDEEKKTVYYQSAEISPLVRNVYSIGLNGKNKKRLSKFEGTNSAVFSKGYKNFINYNSTANTPSRISLHQMDGTEIRLLKDNSKLSETMEDFKLNPKEFFTFTTSENVKLNGWMIKPPNFDESKKYPVFLTIYGGPGSQTVTDSWGGANYFWHQMLAQKGYIVVSVDNRGTGGRGAEFKKITYKELGKYETIDQIEAAKYFASLPYVDGERIGVQGWSYGGYMSSLCLLKGAEHFKAAIAVAPVTNWRFYDSIYTERYMQTPQENPKGYDDNSPINHVEKLEGNYLLIHGTADDNVHFQNTTEMISALAAANKQFDLFIYPDKNHGIYGGNTRLHLYQKMTDFIVDKL